MEFTEGGRTWKTAELGEPGGREDPLSGLSFAEPPKDWFANVGSSGQARLGGPGVRADVAVIAGYGDLDCDLVGRTMMRGGSKSKFAGRDVLRDDSESRGQVSVQMMIPYKRRLMTLRVRIQDPKKVESSLAQLAKLLAPTLE